MNNFFDEPIQPINDFSSLFDEQFTIKDFSRSFADAETEADNTLASVKDAISKKLNKENPKYVVDMDKATSDGLQNGTIKLCVENGETVAQVRNPDGTYGKKLKINEEEISSAAVQMAIQMEAIKEQLQTIIENIREIEDRVIDISQGQRNDRIGLFYSGLSLYLEAKFINDAALKKQVIAQALKSVNDANAQMIQDLRQSVSYLVTEKYKDNKRMTAKIREHLDIIHQCYDVVYRSSFLKAMIYQEAYELPAMLASIEEYGRFVEKLIVPFAGKLTELDSNNKFIEKGTWGRIAKTLTECREIQYLISNNPTYEFALGGKTDGEQG